MRDTSPPILSIWSGPAAPECCLASRSQARLCSEKLQSRLDQTLQAHLNGLGSTIYAIAWKQHVTPLGRTISRQRASARRTSDSAPSSEPFPKSGWPTATVGNATGSQMAKDATPTGRRPDGSKATVSLPQVASFAGWPTAQASDGSGGGQAKRALNPERSNDLMDFALLAGWSTASARDWKDTAGMATEATNPDGSTRTRLDQLGRQVQLAGWPTADASGFGAVDLDRLLERRAECKARTGNGNGFGLTLGQAAPLLAGWPTCTVTDAQRGEKYDPFAANMTLNMAAQRAAWVSIDGPARLTAFGHLLIGSTAGMPSGGQLNPEHSRWLQGYRAVWGSCGATAMQSIRTRRRSSSARSVKRPAPPTPLQWLVTQYLSKTSSGEAA